ncbi:glycoside hydrolase family 9 protein [Vibrio sp. VB16]|uniref:glycoside hydrolase family 9 protein n=1 Tax=Vibrio sp. VB16 TaxID=2785746 RepID=UPI00189F02B9|nr:glycoside hydrolase family 9 protein [Vibrio sp. VB16]UGA55260.1 glycoside hydrolase family 9 protein [Vibrio sp. VB16]
MKILVNHIGYEVYGPKQALISTQSSSFSLKTIELHCAITDKKLASYLVTHHYTVANWHTGRYLKVDFSIFTRSGQFYLKAGDLCSSTFELGEGILMQRTFSDLLHYFKSQRCGGIFDEQDKQAPLLNSDKTANVSGGWYDASGDVSKYLSHLSYANYLNPQQTPMVVWNMLKGLSLLDSTSLYSTSLKDSALFADFSRTRLIEEALFGADFLVRMQDEQGFFYTTVFDKWSKDIAQREICAYTSQDGIKSDDFQAGFRQGGGVAIAALAAASRIETHGEYNQSEYLASAEKGYLHLRDNNKQYLDNGEENIIDEYCALLACSELYRATKTPFYLSEARDWAIRLSKRQHSDSNINHYWSANNDGTRPYFHASEAGLPVIALCEYLSIEPEDNVKKSIKSTVGFAMIFELTITQKVSNPFGYPRQYVKALDGAKQDNFFIPHNNESGYWWQGENARIASLAVATFLSLPYIDDVTLKLKLNQYAHNCMNWILGLNPFDICMLDGHGRNNPNYLPKLGFFNAKGGICNGITSGFEDENDIAFNPKNQKDDMVQNWRWGEQWIPHGAWYLLAIMAQTSYQHGEEEPIAKKGDEL